MKDLVIGVFSNYGFNDVKPWIQSIKQTSFEGDVVLIGIDTKPGTMERIAEEGVIAIPTEKQKGAMIHMERFLHIYNYLNQHRHEYRNVVSTDVRDVIFQLDPSPYMQGLFDRNDGLHLIASSEAIRIKDEEWNRNNIIKNFGQFFYEDIKEQLVLNVGILAGDAGYMKDLCFFLFQMSMGRADWVADQAAYNMIMHREVWDLVTWQSWLEDAWAINAHVTNYEKDIEKFKPFLVEPAPTMNEEGIVVNENGTPFVIVHQYDRVRDWKKVVEKRFDVKIPSQYTPDEDVLIMRTDQ